MISSSIRWRLSITYGGMSLLASIFLGAILLFSLQRFYQQQEHEYLLQNGVTIGRVLYDFEQFETDQSIIESQIRTFAFLTQTRIELIGPDKKEIIFDSGSPDQQSGILTLGLQVVTDEGTQEFTQNLSQEDDAYEAEIVIDNGSQSFRSVASVSGTGSLAEEFFTPLHLVGDPASGGGRSDQTVWIVLNTEFDPEGEKNWLRMSEGPAYGRSIIEDVSIGLVVAGGLATLLTSLFGWWLSGRLALPLDELAAVSHQMGKGDLSVRTDINRQDEIGRVATSFNRMAERVTDTVSSLRRFVADAAHEINTPITALKGNLELLEPTVPKQHSHLLERALDQTSRIQTLSADLLQLSELDGAAPIEMKRLDIVDLIEQQNERIAAEAEQAGIEFSQQLSPSPIWVNGHRPSLLSLYQNLIENALKFTPEGGAVEVALQRDGESAVLTVFDNGIGLNGDTELIFDRFYRSPKAAAYPGNGLGLAIGAKVAEQHGGSLSAKSADGSTVFTFQLFCE